jgi:hypothetical protein
MTLTLVQVLMFLTFFYVYWPLLRSVPCLSHVAFPSLSFHQPRLCCLAHAHGRSGPGALSGYFFDLVMMGCSAALWYSFYKVRVRMCE